jgi:hypothetical protein
MLRMFENRVLGRIFGNKLEKLQEGCKKLHKRAFIICTFQQILLGDGQGMLQEWEIRNAYRLLIKRLKGIVWKSEA